MTSRSSFHRHSFSSTSSSATAAGSTLVAPRPSKVAAQAATALIGKLADLAQDTLNKPSTQKLLNRVPSPVANIFKDDPDTGPSVLDHVASLLPAKLSDNLIGLQGITRVLSSIVRTTAAILSWRRPHIERLIKEAERSGDGRETPYFSPHPPHVAVLAMAVWTLVCFQPIFLLASLPLWAIALVPTAPTDLRTPRTPGSGTLRRHGMNRIGTGESTSSSEEETESEEDDDGLIIPPPHQPLAPPPALPPRSRSVSLSSSQELCIDQVTEPAVRQSQLNSPAPPLPPRPSEPIIPIASSTNAFSSDTQYVPPHPRTSSVNSSHLRIPSHQSVGSFTSTSSTLDPSFDPTWSPPTQPPSRPNPSASTPTSLPDNSLSPSSSPLPAKRATKGPATQAVHDLLEMQSIILSSADRVRQLLAILGFDSSITRWASTVAKPPPEDMPVLNSKKEQTENELIGQGVPLVFSVSALAGWFGVAWIGLLVPAVWAGGIAAMIVFSDLGLFYMALIVPHVRRWADASVGAVRAWWLDLRLRWAGLGHAAGYEPPKTRVGKLLHALVMEVCAVARAVVKAWAYRLLFWWANLAFDVRRAVVGRERCQVVDDEDEDQAARWLFAEDDDQNEPAPTIRANLDVTATRTT
ncbi:hypothetical protein BCR44DRAFT_42821 [Catenaria anguillulae PL171]|uniref:Uncharacterized protein n=1 Tax=Catenaria anguillulae PL171 TaxID=765915 RepID=A0A1Y2HW59_9FUNG|nr:hypothetical protein BCR44DRAFT_42821 [Catenaria anguillulae PL171]